MSGLGHIHSSKKAYLNPAFWAILVSAMTGCGSEDSGADGAGVPGPEVVAPVQTPVPAAPPPAATPAGTPTTPVGMTGSGTTPPVQPTAPTMMDGTAGAGAPMMMPPPAPETCTKGSTDGNDVAMIGDSFFALSGDIAKVLQDLAREAGSLPPTGKYRTYYVSGTQLEGGFSPRIPEQFTNGLAKGPIKTVIMTGGANDVLIDGQSCGGSPAPDGAACKNTIDTAAMAASKLLEEMAAAGVQNVIYMFYPYLPPGREGLNKSLDYGYTVTSKLCEEAPLPCYFIDQREAYKGHMEYFMWDNTHPTLAGSTVSAGLIWDVMQEQCIAQ